MRLPVHLGLHDDTCDLPVDEGVAQMASRTLTRDGPSPQPIVCSAIPKISFQHRQLQPAEDVRMTSPEPLPLHIGFLTGANRAELKRKIVCPRPHEQRFGRSRFRR